MNGDLLRVYLRGYLLRCPHCSARRAYGDTLRSRGCLYVKEGGTINIDPPCVLDDKKRSDELTKHMKWLRYKTVAQWIIAAFAIGVAIALAI